jgi:hypothetical protein
MVITSQCKMSHYRESEVSKVVEPEESRGQPLQRCFTRLVTRHPGFWAAARGRARGTRPPPTAPARAPHDSSYRGDSADDPSSKTRDHSANRRSVPRAGSLSGRGVVGLSEGLCDAWQSSTVIEYRAGAVSPPILYQPSPLRQSRDTPVRLDVTGWWRPTRADVPRTGVLPPDTCP